jgi:hypothetical protein
MAYYLLVLVYRCSNWSVKEIKIKVTTESRNPEAKMASINQSKAVGASTLYYIFLRRIKVRSEQPTSRISRNRAIFRGRNEGNELHCSTRARSPVPREGESAARPSPAAARAELRSARAMLFPVNPRGREFRPPSRPREPATRSPTPSKPGAAAVRRPPPWSRCRRAGPKPPNHAARRRETTGRIPPPPPPSPSQPSSPTSPLSLRRCCAVLSRENRAAR